MNIRQPVFCIACITTALLPSLVMAYANYCHEIRAPVQRNSMYCSGLTIPAHKTRNFRYEQLLCTSGSDRKTRSPIAFDEESWRDQLNTDRRAAYDMLRQLPAPQWQSVIHYRTYLHWNWEACELVTSSVHCGIRRACEIKTNSEGKKEQHCRDEPETCYTDIGKSDSMLCSNEQIQYEVYFRKTDESEWNPDQDTFIDRLANGYDLLPGEDETIIASNGAGQFNTGRLYPDISFKNKRNNYQISSMTEEGFDFGPLTCKQDADYHVGFIIIAQGRIRSRSGNGFSLPVSHDGVALEPLIWQSAINRKGERQAQGYPAVLRVQDYSATALQEFARDVDDIFKHIVVRVQLHKHSCFGNLPWSGSTIYIQEGQGVLPSLNALSSEQNVRRSTLWEIGLENSSIDPNKNLYRLFVPWFVYYPGRLLFPAWKLSYENQLKPDTQYQLSLTVYQKGLNIYFQSCEDEPDAWDCQFYAGWGWFSPSRYENYYYSANSLEVSFTSPDDINLRTWWPTIWITIGLLDDLALAGGIAFIIYKKSQ